MINIIATTCIKNEGKILLVQQNKKDYKDLWDFPGGKVEENEDIINAAVRETIEETGYNVRIENILLMQNYVTPKGVMLIIYFEASLTDNERIKYRENEIKNTNWFSFEEIREMAKENIRGGENITNLLENLKSNIKYPLEMIEIYK